MITSLIMVYILKFTDNRTQEWSITYNMLKYTHCSGIYVLIVSCYNSSYHFEHLCRWIWPANILKLLFLSITPYIAIFILDFGFVLTVWYFSLFILFVLNNIEHMYNQYLENSLATYFPQKAEFSSRHLVDCKVFFTSASALLIDIHGFPRLDALVFPLMVQIHAPFKEHVIWKSKIHHNGISCVSHLWEPKVTFHLHSSSSWTGDVGFHNSRALSSARFCQLLSL